MNEEIDIDIDVVGVITERAELSPSVNDLATLGKLCMIDRIDNSMYKYISFLIYFTFLNAR